MSEDQKRKIPSPILGGGNNTPTSLVFRTDYVFLGSHKLKVEIADEPALQQHGLMFRKKLEEEQGMLFVYDKAQILKFWMLNTAVPLSVGFFDDKGTLFEIRDMRPFSIYPQTESSKPARYALEVNEGWFERHAVTAGCQLTFASEKEVKNVP
ncbi:DUF192 domain-containing protein [bacterium]|nr:DUF192 domain-containing protein [bacterium]